jgi:hypothetical protein
VFIDKLVSLLKSQLPDVSIDTITALGVRISPTLINLAEQSHTLRFVYHSAARDVFVFFLVTSRLELLVSFGFEYGNVKRVEQEREKAQGGVVQEPWSFRCGNTIRSI